MAHQSGERLSGQRASIHLPAGSALVAILLGVAGGAWLLCARLATPDMRLGVLTGGAAMSAHRPMGMAGATSMGLSAFMATWTVMMVAMMVPAVIPAARAFDRAARTTALFLAGYLLVWSASGVVADSVMHAVQDGLPLGTMAALRRGAVLLVVAGVYQLTPPQQARLYRCRSPRRDAATLGQGRLQGVRAGLEQGLYCLGSSWPLMLVLLLVGLMNLAWMGVIAGLIVVEKVVPGGDVAGTIVGWALTAGGLILLVAPHTLPALGGA